MSMTLDVQRRRDNAVSSSARRQKGSAPTGSRRLWGTVLTIDNGPPPSVTVEFEPGGIPKGPFRFLDLGVAPAVDDYVFMENVDGDLIVIGHTATLLPRAQAPLYLRSNLQIDNYQLVLSDALGVVVEFDTTISVSCFIPDIPWVDGTTIELYAVNTGQITVVPESGVTLRAPNGTRSAHQYATMGLRYSGSRDEWIMSGDCTS